MKGEWTPWEDERKLFLNKNNSILTDCHNTKLSFSV